MKNSTYFFSKNDDYFGKIALFWGTLSVKSDKKNNRLPPLPSPAVLRSISVKSAQKSRVFGTLGTKKIAFGVIICYNGKNVAKECLL